MNIFVTCECPIACAKVLDDLRLNKMILETGQMLSTAVRITNPNYEYLDKLYKITHVNHPCTKWARNCKENYNWLFKHFESLCFEFQYRRDKVHTTETKLLPYLDPIVGAADKINYCYLPIQFVNCSAYKDYEDVFIAYQKTLRDKWDNDKRPPKWTKRQEPWL